jgi:hypothetical protein
VSHEQSDVTPESPGDGPESGISAGTVASVVTRANAMTLTWDAVGSLSGDALERALYGPKLAPGRSSRIRL